MADLQRNPTPVSYTHLRSIDEINVQIIMEKLGGGGHLNVAGAQLTGVTIVPVSYTHLDVYKRQSMTFVLSFVHRPDKANIELPEEKVIIG